MCTCIMLIHLHYDTDLNLIFKKYVSKLAKKTLVLSNVEFKFSIDNARNTNTPTFSLFFLISSCDNVHLKIFRNQFFFTGRNVLMHKEYRNFACGI